MAAREILNAQGISLPIQPVAGHLTDHYDPRHKILNLSDTVRNDRSIASIGIALYALVLIFQLVTLPVEFNASRRAMAILSERNILMPHELPGARAVLRAAALTYVAAAAATFLQLLRLILIFGGGSRNRRS